ncbi:MAG: hypothetical protein HN872_01600 [Gammaproteobacteria bacterium]|nr:hypothetical protein [Gammaproteobacteria bacterium]
MQPLTKKHSYFLIMPSPRTALFYLLTGGLLITLSSPTHGQTSQRWFQIELSIFSNESLGDRDEEMWNAERSELSYASPLRRLDEPGDLLITDSMIAAAISEPEELAIEEATIELNDEELAAADLAQRLSAVVATGPQPPRAQGEFRFFDLLRDPNVQLGPQDSDFQQTNRAIERSSEHRLLFHGLWRESLADPNKAIPIYVHGGLKYGDQHELQGSITLRFNDNRDRIVIDSDLWLTEYSAVADLEGDWQLPPIPEAMLTPVDAIGASEPGLAMGINRVFHMQQSREMRSTEFHYIDHPAMGIVILVEPYEVPPLPIPDFDFEDAN